MGIFAPSGYLSLRDARDILRRCMYEGVPSSEEIERTEAKGFTPLMPNTPRLPQRPSASPSCWAK
jgi:hypothetical protein